MCQRERHALPGAQQQQDRIGDRTVHQFGEAGSVRWLGFVLPGLAAQRHGKHRDLQVLALVVAIVGHADGVRLERRDPLYLLDGIGDQSLVGSRGGSVLQQQLLRHALIDSGSRRADQARR
jgi:hypothetical protein